MININEIVFALFLSFFTSPQATDFPNNIEDSVTCLALNMYYEARGQKLEGLFAVSYVVLNRVKDKRFPNTICKVVKQGPVRESWKKNGKFYPVRDRCQFSWYCDGKSDNPKDKKIYQKLLTTSKLIIIYSKKSFFIDITDGALFYHAYYVLPIWVKTKYKTVRIGDHIFYR
jgi:spore germination cell wall hydrolase CwlJ-like protein